MRPIILPFTLSPMLWPPTPGSYQSPTTSEPSGAIATSAGRYQLSLEVRMSTIVAL